MISLLFFFSRFIFLKLPFNKNEEPSFSDNFNQIPMRLFFLSSCSHDTDSIWRESARQLGSDNESGTLQKHVSFFHAFALLFINSNSHINYLFCSIVNIIHCLFNFVVESIDDSVFFNVCLFQITYNHL